MTGRTTKRIFVNESNQGVNGQLITDYKVTADKVNCSNIWFSFTIEPENADANAQGSWVLFANNREEADIDWTDANLNDDTLNQLVIAAGVWSASNQTPITCSKSAGNISRNIRKDGKLGLTIKQTGITAGLSSIRGMLMCNTTTL